MACAEVKFVDVPDAGYFANNKPSQGEIWLRGPSITKGYYNRDKETEEAFTEDGWFKTGDIGEWEPSGTIKIIDRKKNLVKTLNGEYIALEKVPHSPFLFCNGILTDSWNPFIVRVISFRISSYMRINRNQSLSQLFFQQNLHSRHLQNKRDLVRKKTILKIWFIIVNSSLLCIRNYLPLVNVED